MMKGVDAAGLVIAAIPASDLGCSPQNLSGRCLANIRQVIAHGIAGQADVPLLL